MLIVVTCACSVIVIKASASQMLSKYVAGLGAPLAVQLDTPPDRADTGMCIVGCLLDFASSALAWLAVH